MKIWNFKMLMARRFCLAFFCLILFSINVLAEERSSDENADSVSLRVWNNHLKPSISDGFDRTGWMILSGGALAVMLLQPQDDAVRGEWAHNHIIAKSSSEIGDFLGSGIPSLMIIGGQYWLGDTHEGAAHFEAFLYGGITSSIGKILAGRRRPGGSTDTKSMPSGHTTVAFASATSLSYAYGWKMAVPSYLLASFVAASRWSDDAHWLTDTIAGAAIGVFWGRATSFHELGLYPLVARDGAGLGWQYYF